MWLTVLDGILRSDVPLCSANLLPRMLSLNSCGLRSPSGPLLRCRRSGTASRKLLPFAGVAIPSGGVCRSGEAGAAFVSSSSMSRLMRLTGFKVIPVCCLCFPVASPLLAGAAGGGAVVTEIKCRWLAAKC